MCLRPPRLLLVFHLVWAMCRCESSPHTSHLCVETLDPHSSEAEPGSLTSEVPEAASLCHSSDERHRVETAGVMHYLSLCNKQMPLRWL